MTVVGVPNLRDFRSLIFQVYFSVLFNLSTTVAPITISLDQFIWSHGSLTIYSFFSLKYFFFPFFKIDNFPIFKFTKLYFFSNFQVGVNTMQSFF